MSHCISELSTHVTDGCLGLQYRSDQRLISSLSFFLFGGSMLKFAIRCSKQDNSYREYCPCLLHIIQKRAMTWQVLLRCGACPVSSSSSRPRKLPTGLATRSPALPNPLPFPRHTGCSLRLCLDRHDALPSCFLLVCYFFQAQMLWHTKALKQCFSKHGL